MTKQLPTHVHLHGALCPLQNARVSVFDRGFLYGDGLFETVRAYSGRPLALATHLARLRSSAHLLGIPLPRRPWAADIARLLRRNRLHDTDASVRITVTRGTAIPGLLPPTRPRPTVLIAATPLDEAIVEAQLRGARAVLLPFSRDGFLAEHKLLDYLPGVLGKVIAKRRQAFEAFYVNTAGYVTEGTTTNLFVCHRRRLITPPAEGILPGVTRSLVLALAAASGVRVTEKRLKAQDLFSADELFVTSSVAEVVPIIKLDERRIGNGRVGPLTQRLQGLYRQLVDKILQRS
jgi:branched-chain amino acid aminotransferase